MAGKGMNPCIDCRTMKIRKAVEYMREIGGSFLFTGEVLASADVQHRRAIDIIDKESGVAGLILRPLSARLFAETVSEKEGWWTASRSWPSAAGSRKPDCSCFTKGINDFRCRLGAVY